MMIAALWRPIVVWRGLPTYISIEFLFLFFSYLIYFYPYQLHVLGIADISRSGFIVGPTFTDESNRAIMLASIGMTAFRAGLKALKSRPTDQPASAVRSQASGYFDRVTSDMIAGPVLLLQVLLISIYLAFGWRAAGEGRYNGETSTNSVVEGVYLLIVVFGMISFAVLIFPTERGQPTSRSPSVLLGAVVAGAWAIRLLLNGDRNSFLLIALVAVGGLLTFRIRKGRWVLFLFGVSAILLYNAIEALRSGEITSLFDFFADQNAPASGKSRDGDSSFNITTIGVRGALAGVPGTIDYGFGIFKLIGVLGVIPLIRGAVIPIDTPYKTSSDVLNQIVLGGPSAGWSIGTSVISDSYIDFGVLGVPVLLFLVGAFAKYTENGVRSHPDSLWRAVLYLLTLALVTEVPRYAFDFPVRPLVWAVLLFWVVSMFTPALRASVRGDEQFRSSQGGGFGSAKF